MKTNKFFLALILPVLLLSSCASEDDEPLVPIEHEVEITLDFDALAALEGNDATELAIFDNGLSAADFSTDAIIGDVINYRIISSANTEIICTDYLYDSGDLDLWSNGLKKLDDGQGMVIGLEVLAPAEANQECKFNILFRVSNNGVEDPKEYLIDPKIRIKTKR